MDGALVPGIRTDVVVVLGVRGDLVLPVRTTGWIDDSGIVAAIG